MRYYIIAGDPSGDIHGATLIKEIKHIDSHASFWVCGGPHMEEAIGEACQADYKTIASIGLDFFKKSYKLWKLLRFCKKNLQSYNPDIVVLIDSAGFNLRLASFAKRCNFQVYYYIAPKIWAHGADRIKRIKRNVTKILSILPFERDYYRLRGYAPIHYMGNPLVKQVKQHNVNPLFKLKHTLDERPIIALLPGSRVGEVQRILPTLVAVATYFPTYQFVVGALSQLPKSLYSDCCPPSIKVVYDQTYDLMAHAKVGLVASGTATLEAALFNLPQIVVYKTAPLTYFFYRRKLKISHISLVNILADQAVVPELLQHKCTPKHLTHTLHGLLTNKEIELQQKSYEDIHASLGKGHAACKTARLIVSDTLYNKTKYYRK